MSRSYKKVPIIKDSSKAKPFFKKIANKKVRKNNVINGRSYKKLYDSYNINDQRKFDKDDLKAERK